MNCQKWDNAENLQEFASSVAMKTFIRNIAKLFIFQYFCINVNESPYKCEFIYPDAAVGSNMAVNH